MHDPADIDGSGFVPRRFEDLSDLRFRAATGPHPADPQATVLLLAFEGSFGPAGRKRDGDGDFMEAMIRAAMAAWRAEAVILDLRTLAYVWGDQMEGPLAACRLYVEGFHGEAPAIRGVRVMFDPGDWTGRYRRLIVVSERCREGLTSLLRLEMGEDPSQVLHPSLEEALAALARL